ncbi:hypothetical protein JHW43_002987 [Diplocarpon mali]|nr:hypothetical protein JHW43_002987 [Diplocarpon mali]
MSYQVRDFIFSSVQGLLYGRRRVASMQILERTSALYLATQCAYSRTSSSSSAIASPPPGCIQAICMPAAAYLEYNAYSGGGRQSAQHESTEDFVYPPMAWMLPGFVGPSQPIPGAINPNVQVKPNAKPKARTLPIPSHHTSQAPPPSRPSVPAPADIPQTDGAGVGTLFKQSRAEQSRAEQSRAEQSRAEQSRAEQSRAEQSRAEQSRAEQSRAEQGHRGKVASPMVLSREQGRVRSARQLSVAYYSHPA